MKIAFTIPNMHLRCRKCMKTTMPRLNPLMRKMEADIDCDCDDPGLELVMESSPAGAIPLAILPLEISTLFEAESKAPF